MVDFGYVDGSIWDTMAFILPRALLITPRSGSKPFWISTHIVVIHLPHGSGEFPNPCLIFRDEKHCLHPTRQQG